MCFREKLVMIELSGIINVFHDISAALCTVTRIHHKAEFLQEVINVFCNINITLFMIASEKAQQPDSRKQDGR